MNLGFGEIFLILLIVLILFGAKKIPEIARSLGVGLKEFKKGMKEIESDIEKNNDSENKNEEKK
ncbi:MAG TPA: twin-arginine translocase TatA/TatE family subunit [Spirochaetota bacterium]|nr:twin-arginine translocase TatA/TatE family subunit [Spirochaetota bacterium]HOL57670.1 twin-arginine translocase TatA/TatE family subunit [Spirochaetota bacterium]HPP05274.1 twin-arginine translocase TatA/TatE family subunit [Spirochaetota bacterium]